MVAALGPTARLLGIGWYFVLSIGVGVLGGWWLGQRFSSTALQILCALAGLALGLLLAGWGGYRFVRTTLDEASEEAEEEERHRLA